MNGRRVTHAAIEPGAVLRVGDCVGHFQSRTEEPGEFGEVGPGLFGGVELARILDVVRRAAVSDLPIVLIGETGTGKERVAEAAHRFSGRSGRFQALNCAAIPSDMAEAELFGYRKGAFTGAERASLGHLRAASGGTLFLDEVGDLSSAVQAKLLRALEERRVTPLGEVESVPLDVRIVTALQQSLDELVRAGRFREDLRQRLAGLVVSLPSLRQRRGDVIPLFRHFLSQHTGGRPPGIPARLVEALLMWTWPGNVRELELVARQMLALHGHELVLRRSFLPARITADLPEEDEPVPPAGSRREDDLRKLADALRETRGDVKAAAARAGISRQRAYRLMDGTSAAELMSGAPTAPKEAER